MKKIRRFNLQNSSFLSREEMAAIEGSDGSWVDVCTSYGQTCVLKTVYVDGDPAFVFGTCKKRSMNTPAGLIFYYSCER